MTDNKKVDVENNKKRRKKRKAQNITKMTDNTKVDVGAEMKQSVTLRCDRSLQGGGEEGGGHHIPVYVSGHLWCFPHIFISCTHALPLVGNSWCSQALSAFRIIKYNAKETCIYYILYNIHQRILNENSQFEVERNLLLLMILNSKTRTVHVLLCTSYFRKERV